jgi:hypothetical protein
VPVDVNALALEPVVGGVMVAAPIVAVPVLPVTLPLEPKVIVPEPYDAPVVALVTVQDQVLDELDELVWLKLI